MSIRPEQFRQTQEQALHLRPEETDMASAAKARNAKKDQPDKAKSAARAAAMGQPREDPIASRGPQGKGKPNANDRGGKPGAAC